MPGEDDVRPAAEGVKLTYDDVLTTPLLPGLEIPLQRVFAATSET